MSSLPYQDTHFWQLTTTRHVALVALLSACRLSLTTTSTNNKLSFSNDDDICTTSLMLTKTPTFSLFDPSPYKTLTRYGISHSMAGTGLDGISNSLFVVCKELTWEPGINIMTGGNGRWESLKKEASMAGGKFQKDKVSPMLLRYSYCTTNNDMRILQMKCYNLGSMLKSYGA